VVQHGKECFIGVAQNQNYENQLVEEINLLSFEILGSW
jgi:hypothetical protein